MNKTKNQNQDDWIDFRPHSICYVPCGASKMGTECEHPMAPSRNVTNWYSSKSTITFSILRWEVKSQEMIAPKKIKRLLQ